MNTPSSVPFCSISSCRAAARRRCSAERGDEVADSGRGEADAQALEVCGGADRLLRGVHVAGLVCEEQQYMHAAMLGIEVLGAQLGVVQGLGADLGAAGT